MLSPWMWLRRTGASRLANEIPRLEFDRRRARVKRDADRIAACGHRVELLAEHPPDHQDAAVALAEMFFRMHRHRTLTDLRLVIARKLLVLLFGHVPPELSVELGAHPSDVARVLHPARDIDPERSVVDRQGPADRLDAGELGDARIGHHAQRGEGGFRHTVKHLAVVLMP